MHHLSKRRLFNNSDCCWQERETACRRNTPGLCGWIADYLRSNAGRKWAKMVNDWPGGSGKIVWWYFASDRNPQRGCTFVKVRIWQSVLTTHLIYLKGIKKLTHKGTQTLYTERLKLRRFTVEDTREMFDNWAMEYEGKIIGNISVSAYPTPLKILLREGCPKMRS